MVIGDKIEDKKIQYDINRVPDICIILSGNIDKHEYLTGEEHCLHSGIG